MSLCSHARVLSLLLCLMPYSIGVCAQLKERGAKTESQIRRLSAACRTTGLLKLIQLETRNIHCRHATPHFFPPFLLPPCFPVLGPNSIRAIALSFPSNQRVLILMRTHAAHDNRCIHRHFQRVFIEEMHSPTRSPPNTCCPNLRTGSAMCKWQQ